MQGWPTRQHGAIGMARDALARVDDFLAALPAQTRALSLRRFRRGTVGSGAKELAYDMVFSTEESQTDFRPYGLELRAVDARGTLLAALELHPLPGPSDDEVLRRCVLARRRAGGEWWLETWARGEKGEERLERLHEPGPVATAPASLRTLERPLGFSLEIDHVPAPPVWVRLIVLAFTVVLFAPLVLLCVFQQGRAVWRDLVLPALWPRRERWTLDLGAEVIRWRWQPGRGDVEEGQVASAEVLAVSLAPGRWEPPASPDGALLRLVTADRVFTLPGAPVTGATRHAGQRLLGWFKDAARC